MFLISTKKGYISLHCTTFLCEKRTHLFSNYTYNCNVSNNAPFRYKSQLFAYIIQISWNSSYIFLLYTSNSFGFDTYNILSSFQRENEENNNG